MQPDHLSLEPARLRCTCKLGVRAAVVVAGAATRAAFERFMREGRDLTALRERPLNKQEGWDFLEKKNPCPG